MVDTFKSSSFGATRLGRANATGIAVMERAQQEPLKIDFIDACRLAAQCDGLTDEGFADGAPPALPLDLAIVADVAHRPTARVANGLWSAIMSPTAPIAIGGIASAQSFMRTLGVVIRSPAITAPLLAERMSRWRTGGVPLEFTMHLFMRAVLLGMAGSNELDADAQSQPPHTQGRKTPSARAAERRSIVPADDLGQTVATEQADKHPSHCDRALVRQNAHRQEKAAEEIADGERIATRALSGAKETFEIHRPDIVGCGGQGQRRQGQTRPAPGMTMAAAHRTKPWQPLGDGAHGGQAGAREFAMQAGVNFLCAPMREALAKAAHRLSPTRRGALGRTTRAARMVVQAGATVLMKPAQPLVATLTADAEGVTQRGEGLELFQSSLSKTPPLSDSRKDFPRHSNRRAASNQNANCQPCLCPHVSTMSMPRAVRADVSVISEEILSSLRWAIMMPLRVLFATTLERQNGDGRLARLHLQPVLHWKIVARRKRRKHIKFCTLSTC
jgi:hypothetical protein